MGNENTSSKFGKAVKWTVGIFVGLFVMGAIFGDSNQDEIAEAAPAPTTTEAPVTTVEEDDTPTLQERADSLGITVEELEERINPPAPTTTQPPRTTTTAEAELDMRDFFVPFLRDWSADKPWNIIDAASDSDLIELAQNACAALDAGASIDDLVAVTVMSLAESGALSDINNEAAGAILGAGTTAFCPEYEW